MKPPWLLMAERRFRFSHLRADYIYEDKYASLGQATLRREPLAFLPVRERPLLTDCDLIKYLPPDLRLSEVVSRLEP